MIQNLKSEYKYLFLILLAFVAVYAYSQYLHYKELQLAIRSHNMRAFSEMIRCDDAPTDVAKCEETFGKFFVKEYGLFNKDLLEILDDK